MNDINLNWCILDYDERDFIAGGDFNIETLPTITTNTNEYNQNEYANQYWHCLCTLYASVWVYSDNLNTSVDNWQRLELTKIRSSMKDFDKNIWWYLSEWINCVRKYFSVQSIRVNKKDFKKILDKWYRLNIWISVKDDYLEDIKDWVLNSTPKWNTKFWHSTTLKKINDNYIVDNYKDVFKHNKISVNNIDEFINSNVVFEWGYLIFSDSDNRILQIKKNIMSNIKLESARKAFELWIWNWKDWDKQVTREEASAMLYRLYEKLNK